MISRALVFAAALLTYANTSLAQPKEPIGRFVADVRAASAGLPTTPGWTPAVPTGTLVPSRGMSIDAGLHVYLLRFRRAALGVGASWLTGRSTSSPTAAQGATTTTLSTPTSAMLPDVTTRMTTLAPQLSLNFGHSLGWSYLSAGLGQSKVYSEATPVAGAAVFAPRDSGWVKTLNYGGGARWFLNDHFGVGFDLRWHKLNPAPPSGDLPGGSRASLLVAGAGVVLK